MPTDTFTRDRAFEATVDRRAPMGAARIVRRERFAWPGGYALALVTHDGALLCPQCVAANYPAISAAHRHKLRDGWQPEALAILEAPEQPEPCDHCGRIIAEPA